MSKREKPPADESAASADFDIPLSGAFKQSAQHIWLAGLGALAQAQEQGSKAFDSLVKDGLSLQRKTLAQTEERLSEAARQLSAAAADAGQRVGGQWDKLENIFESRVAKALHKLGVPTAQDLEALGARIEGLSRQLGQLEADRAARAAAARQVARNPVPGARAAARKPPGSGAGRAAGGAGSSLRATEDAAAAARTRPSGKKSVPRAPKTAGKP